MNNLTLENWKINVNILVCRYSFDIFNERFTAFLGGTELYPGKQQSCKFYVHEDKTCWIDCQLCQVKPFKLKEIEKETKTNG